MCTCRTTMCTCGNFVVTKMILLYKIIMIIIIIFSNNITVKLHIPLANPDPEHTSASIVVITVLMERSICLDTNELSVTGSKHTIIAFSPSVMLYSGS